MANTKTTKPATTDKPAAKPAEAKPAVNPGVGIKELAADLGGRNPRSVRAGIRRHLGGAQVGQGGRYRWDSKADPQYKELLTALQPKVAVKAEEKAQS
jgi:hypothetical protein